MSSYTPSIGNLAPADPGQAVPDPDDAPPKGSFGSLPVVVDNDSTFKLEDAAEEMTFFAAEKRSTELDERDIQELDDGPPLDIERIEALMRLIDGQETGDATSTAKLLQDAADDLNLLESARNLADDPSKQFLLLAHAFNVAKREGLSTAAERLHDALARMERNHGAAVWAGLNIAEVAAKFGPAAKDAATFRAAYRDAVLGETTLSATFKMVLERFGEDRFKSGTALLIHALGADLTAMKPSSDKVRLNAVLQDLYQLQAANTLVEFAQRLAIKLVVHGVQLSAVKLTQALADLASKASVSAWDFEELSRRFVTNSAARSA